MIYFDNRATTRIDKESLDILNDVYINNFGNASSLHQLGFNAEKLLEEKREKFARSLGVKKDEIYFTPSATFADNLAIQGTFNGGNIVINPLEHSAVYNTAKKIYKDVRTLKINDGGIIELDLIDNVVDKNTRIACIMHVNNETGTINDIKAIVKRIKDINSNCIILCDGVQSFGKSKLNLKDLGVDMYVASGHKINGPRGVGLIYISENIKVNPIIFGGNQERGLVSGTENIGAIRAFYNSYKRFLEFDNKEIISLKEYILEELKTIKGYKINGENTSPYIINVSFSKIKSEPMIHLLESHGVYVSSGSACNKGEKSRVLEELNISDEYIDGVIRISFDKNSTLSEGKQFMKILKEDLNTIRSIMN